MTLHQRRPNISTSKPIRTDHKVFLTEILYLKSVPHKPQQNCVVRVHWLMLCQFTCYTEKTSDIRCIHTASHLHVEVSGAKGHPCGWISSHKCYKWTKYLHYVTSADVFDLITPCKTTRTVCTQVWLCICVNIDMMLQFDVCLTPFPTERTFIRSTVTVYMTLVTMQTAALGETFCYTVNICMVCHRVNSHQCSEYQSD